MKETTQIKQGFKQTEVGVIPEDWEVVLLSECAVFGSGTTPSRELQDRYYKNGLTPWIKTLDLNNSEIYNVDERVTETALREVSSLKIYPENSVLVAMYGGFNQIGRTGILAIKACVNQAITVIQCDRKKLAPAFLINYLNFNVDYWKSVASSSRKDPNITSKDVKEFPIPLPPTLAEQEAIAGALSDMDALIAAQGQLIAKKRALKQGAMQELLTGKRRLTGFGAGSGYQQTEVGRIPEDWEVRELGELVLQKPNYGINAPAVPFNEDLPTYLRITDISEDGDFIRSGKVSVNNPEALSYLLDEGDLVFARTGASVGKTYLYSSQDGELVFAGFLIRVKADPQKLLPSYLKYWTQSKFYKDWIIENSTRTGQPGINSNEFVKLPLPLPPTLAEQGAIARVLSDMDTELSQLEAQLGKYEQVKQGMMQELLTGKTRLI